MVIIPEKIVDRLNSHIMKRANEYDLSIIGNSRELIEKYKK